MATRKSRSLFFFTAHCPLPTLHCPGYADDTARHRVGSRTARTASMVTSNSYLDIFLMLVLSTTVLPVPEELPVIAAGVVCGNSDTKFADDRGNPERVRWW